MKKYIRPISSMLAVLMLLLAMPVSIVADDEEYSILNEGLVAWYDGINNTADGHDSEATVWTDLAGDHDIALKNDSNNYFTEDAFHVTDTRFYFPDPIFTLINTNEFTVEMRLGEIEKTGSSYTTMINSSGNDNFALFLRTSSANGDYIEFKSAGNGRPKVANGKELIENSTLSLTFSLKNKICVLYVDGMEIGSASLTQGVGAAGKLFFGHDESSKKHSIDYQSFRFYNRALTANEVANNAKADGNYDFSYVPPREFARVSQAATNIAGGIAFSEVFDTVDKVEGLLTRRDKPAIAVLYIDSTLCLTDASGQRISNYDLMSLEQMTDNTVIPAFYVRDEATVNGLCAALSEIGYEDCFIISDNAELVTLARKTYPIARGVLDLTATYKGKTDLTDEEILTIRKTVNKNLSKVVILPHTVANKEDVNKLANYGMTVWIDAREGLEDKKDALYLLLSGAHGILSSKTELLVDVGTNVLVSNTITRMPLNIGHRGTSPTVANAPENTVENALIAYENGANAIEVDVFITGDNHIVINHNSTTTNMKQIATGKPASMSIESKSLAQLKRLYYAGYYEKDENGKDKLDEQGNKIEYTGFKISTLEELFTAFKGKDVVLIIEFKSSKEKLVPAFKKLVDEYDMYDQCSVICYESFKQHARMVEHFPEMTVGLLWGSISANANKVDESLKTAVQDVQKHNTTLNPNYSGFTAPYVRAATYRGVTVWPYTINNTNDIQNNFLYGHAALTGDYSAIIGGFTKTLNLSYGSAAQPGSTVTIKAETTTYKRDTKETGKAVLTILEGEDLIEKTEGLSITAKENVEGEIWFMVSYEHKLAAAKSYTIYTQPQRLVISKDAVVEPPSEESPDPSESIPDESITPSESIPDESPAPSTSRPEESTTGDVTTDDTSVIDPSAPAESMPESSPEESTDQQGDANGGSSKNNDVVIVIVVVSIPVLLGIAAVVAVVLKKRKR